MGARPWRIGDRIYETGTEALVMGVLNVTPDSFSDGGRFVEPEEAVKQAHVMAAEGAAIIDIGGESTRPAAATITVEEELRRVLPVLQRLRPLPAHISIDTRRAEVAEAALDCGATIINDVSGGRDDPAMFVLAARRKAAFIVMHMQGTPQTMQNAPHYEDVVGEVVEFFRQQNERALESGIDPMALAFDPGIGFGKALAHNLTLLARLNELRVGDRPLVVGVSRKSFIGKALASEGMDDRETATVALSGILRGRGADVVRVHKVRENVIALRMAEAMEQATR